MCIIIVLRTLFECAVICMLSFSTIKCTHICWRSIFVFLGVSGIFFTFVSFWNKIPEKWVESLFWIWTVCLCSTKRMPGLIRLKYIRASMCDFDAQCIMLTYINLASFLLDISKQCRPRQNVAIRVSTVCFKIWMKMKNIIHTPLKMEMDCSYW